MGIVYKARQLSLDRTVALKILSDRLSKDREFVARFMREARIAAMLDHVNVIRALDVGEAEGLRYFAMEYVEGENLGTILDRDGRMPEDKAIGIVMQAARALQHAWEHQLIHRDIKPDNIIITSKGVAKVADLGLARSTDDKTTRMTVTGTAMGTPHYISPEQARGEPDIDIRTDIYSLGVTFYHMLVGHPPFQGSTAAVVVTRRLTETPPWARDAAPEVSEGAALVIKKMMARERGSRYTDPKELISDLELIADGKLPEIARREPQAVAGPAALPAPQAAAPARAPVNPVVWVGAAVGAVLLIAIVLVLAVVGGRAPDENELEAQVFRILTDVKELEVRGELDRAVSMTESAKATYEGSRFGEELGIRLSELRKKREREIAGRERLELVRRLVKVGSKAEALKAAREARGRFEDTPSGATLLKDIEELEKWHAASEESARELRSTLTVIEELEKQGAVESALERAEKGLKRFEGTLPTEPLTKAIARLRKRVAAKLAIENEAKAKSEADARRYQEHMEKSEEKEKAGKLEEAIAEVTSAIRLRSTPEANARLGTLNKRVRQRVNLGAARRLAEAGKVREAREAYRLAFAETPQGDRAALSDEIARFEAKLIGAAAERELAAVRALAADGKLEEALRRASIAARDYGDAAVAGDFASIRDDIRSKISDADTGKEARLLLSKGAELMKAGRHGEAVATFEASLKALDSAEARALLSEARSHLHMGRSVAEEKAGRLQRAIEEVNVALEARSTQEGLDRRTRLQNLLRSRAILDAARDLEKAGKTAEALKAYQDAMRAAPESERAAIAEAIDRLRPRPPLPTAARLNSKRLGLALVLVPGGEYTVGGDGGQRDEAPAHKVRLESYYISIHEITNAQYRRCVPRHSSGPRLDAANQPVVKVAWKDAMRFCAWLSRVEKANYRLPTEAEWEVAARGTDGRRYPWGNEAVDAGGTYRANYAPSKDKNSWGLDGFPYAAPVGSFPAGASPFGCLDMAGNVWEWCHDWYDAGYYAKGPAENPRGPESGTERVLRGGSWYHPIELARPANRDKLRPDISQASIGFRVVMQSKTE
jgi:serine/threonine-protein kinase